MKSVEDKIIEVLNELEKWESRKEKVKERYLEQRKNLEILHYVLGKKPTESLTGISKKS